MSHSPPAYPAKRATILDVAAAAGVSRQTVTRAMNGMPGIKESTRQRVQQLAQELGYTPSRFAKGLVQGARTSVGLAIPDLTNPYFPAFASSVVELATLRGWHVVVDDYGHGGRSGLDAVEHLAPQVDAVIGYLGGYAQQAQSALGRRPLIVLDETPGDAAGSINFDYDHAAKLAVDQLVKSNRRNIAYLEAGSPTGLGGQSPGTVRGKAVAGRLQDLGMSWSLIVAEETADAARAAVARFLREYPETDGILAFNDLMAAGVLKALSAAGRTVPGDCAVIGMDGIPLGVLVTPQLSTMALDLREVGRAAVELLDGLLSGSVIPGSEASRLTLRHRLIHRETA
ncbi:LacI family DNA-binding transcriptional regulator [Arthrobacter sp. B10-11]|uniref:LacI family DNA-binding transcriptional regulator n=1 Tax=Arthrobacter sp. B10-11 TaxID=3081160 RepID=UPI0029532FBE|nr:LacI family DNA-binding transcriptional regulator [Arthrobacter sp. B10-11]MDV8150145.1 LacI family DNA-binding transcriptional regulator [Arthrobacter sp. B10-11]